MEGPPPPYLEQARRAVGRGLEQQAVAPPVERHEHLGPVGDEPLLGDAALFYLMK